MTSTHASNTSMTVPGLPGICHGSAAGSQSGPLGGSDTSVAKPSQAIISPTEADAAAPPAAKRDRSGPSPHDGIITHHAADIAETSLDMSALSDESNQDMGSALGPETITPDGRPPMPTAASSRGPSPAGRVMNDNALAF